MQQTMQPINPASEPLVTDPMVPHTARVTQAQRDTHDTFTLTLELPDLEPGLPFVPGQFTMLYLFGAGEVPISISGDPAEPQRLVHTIRAVGKVTQPMQALKTGAMLGVRGPFGTGWPVEAARGHDVVLVAGGIGLAPLRPVIYHMLTHREDYGHISLFYGARTPEDILYGDELQAWGGRFDMDVAVIVDHASSGWHGDIGVVTKLLGRAGGDAGNTVAMTCGPEIMMRFTIRELHHLGLADEQIYVSMERNMHCATGTCGHCQYGPLFICRDGPVFRYDSIRPYFGVREI